VQGWDDPRLVRILAGEVTGEDGSWEPEEEDEDGDLEYDDDFDDDPGARFSSHVRAEDWGEGQLVRVRLRILERQGRLEEYLNLARGEHQTVAYATMLVRLGRGEEAVAYARAHLTTPAEALVLARTLDEHGRPADALGVAEHGLTLDTAVDRAGAFAWQTFLGDDGYLPFGGRVELARWLREAAQAAGEAERALRAARAAVEASADLDDYRAAEALAGERWPELRAAILAHLRRGAPTARVSTVDILLYERLIDEAIAIADAAPYHYRMVEQVAEAAIESHPEWVIRACRAQAEQIMDAGKAQHYDTAARWLAKARAASLAAGRDAEWAVYLAGLLDTHRRKYKLVPMLQRLR
jgi:uncharacterized Zn finger protein